jgi:glycosyltransferase 2 family protein
MKRKILIIIGWLVSLVFLFLTFRKIDHVELWNTLKTAEYIWLIPNIALVMLMMVYRAFRWQIMLDPIKKVGMNDLFASTIIGFMANNILPLRMGEFVRAYSVGRLGNLSRSASFATIVLERIFDIFILLLMLAVILIFRLLPLDPEGAHYNNIMYVGYLMLAMSIALFVLLVFLKIKSDATLKLLKKTLVFLPGRISSLVLDIFKKFAEGLSVLGDFKSMIRITFHSIILWIVTALSNYFIFMVFGLNDLPLSASFVVLIVVTLGITIPNAPGYIGVFHALVVLALSFYPVEVTPAEARGCAIVMHGAQYVIITAVGFYYLYRRHLSLHEVKTTATDTKE